MNEFTKGGGNRRGLAATDPTLKDRLDDLVFAGYRAFFHTAPLAVSTHL